MKVAFVILSLLVAAPALAEPVAVNVVRPHHGDVTCKFDFQEMVVNTIVRDPNVVLDKTSNKVIIASCFDFFGKLSLNMRLVSAETGRVELAKSKNGEYGDFLPSSFILDFMEEVLTKEGLR